MTHPGYAARGNHLVLDQAASRLSKPVEETMKSVFDPAYPSEQQTAAFWEEVILDAQAERLIRRIEQGLEPEPWLWDD